MSSDREVAIVTGGTRGIGRAIARELAHSGCDVALTFRSDEAHADAARREIETIGRRALVVRSDAADAVQAAAVVTAARDTLGAVRVLVNNAGILRDRVLYSMSEEDWDSVVDTNLKGAFNFCRAAAASMMKQEYGRIINVTSVSALRGLPGQANYAAAKAGLIGFTRSLARELGRFQITVNAVAPGYIQGDMLQTLSARSRQEALEQIPCRRFGSAEEVARLVAFLASPKSGYISGQVFVIDGGLTA
ncbi:MAG TPA: 3-oxoacyl-[acyl-carrier-protein] reductase [Candidatus Dormibacteraeota bacterium]|nr:3-oxoacyl-[acyl-carrier-protein] reductase [Candidatus Dormibacteraeota bacterium]